MPQPDAVSQDDVVEVAPVVGAGRRRRWPAVAFVLVLTLAVGGVAAWLATRDRVPLGNTLPGGQQAAATCPTSPQAGVVPATPTTAGAVDQLVPDGDPVSITLCEYGSATGGGYSGLSCAPMATTSAEAGGLACWTPASSGSAASDVAAAGGLGRSSTLAGSDPAVAPLLDALRTAAPPLTGGDLCSPGSVSGTTSLVGLTYADGLVWVTSVGPCSGSTNGVVSSALQLDPLVAAALDSGVTSGAPSSGTVEPAPPTTGTTPFPGEPTDPGYPSSSPSPVIDPLAACLTRTTGPAGDFVPFTPVGVRLCHLPLEPSPGAGAGALTVDRPADVAVSLANALAELPVLEPDIACPAIGGETWALLFTAADGSSVSVQVDAGGCGTASNGARLAKSDTALFTALAAAAG